MGEPLTALDATFLELEDADDGAHMHIGALMVFDPLPGGGTPSLDEFADRLQARLGAIPRYGERLSQTHSGPLRRPSWEPVPDFEVRDHLRRVALPAPAGEAELLDWAAEFWSHRLERTRPLWEAVLVEGLPSGRWAICTKTHHCMIDGVGSVDAAYLMLDRTPTPDPAIPESEPRPAVDHHGLAHTAAVQLLHALDPRHVRETLDRSRAAIELVIRDELIGAPRTSLNVPLGSRRRIAVVRVSLAEVKRLKNVLGGTVNDVALAVVTAGLRRLLLSRGEDPPEAGLRAMVPVNIRTAGEPLAPGNQVTSLFVHLPVAEYDPALRYQRVMHESQGLKHGRQAKGSTTVVELAGLAPPPVHAMFARALFGTRLFNVTVTNVPGPPETLYALGAPLRDVFGLVPLAADHALGVAVLSYDGKLTFTIDADYDSMPDVAVVVAGMEAELEALHELAGSRTLREVSSASAPSTRRARQR